MATDNPLARFHTFMTVYESCRASALGNALQMTPIAAHALDLIYAFPGMTLHELSCILGGSQGQIIGAVFDLQHLGYIEPIEERDDNGRRVLKPIKARMFGFDGYLRLANNLAADAGHVEQLEALLAMGWFWTVASKLAWLCDGAMASLGVAAGQRSEGHFETLASQDSTSD